MAPVQLAAISEALENDPEAVAVINEIAATVRGLAAASPELTDALKSQVEKLWPILLARPALLMRIARGVLLG
jgi:hypothetical protein